MVAIPVPSLKQRIKDFFSYKLKRDKMIRESIPYNGLRDAWDDQQRQIAGIEARLAKLEGRVR